MLSSLLLCAALAACSSPPVTTPPIVTTAAAPVPAKPTITIGVTAAGDTVASAAWAPPNGNGGSPPTGYVFRWIFNGVTQGSVKTFGLGVTVDTLVLAVHDTPGGAVGLGSTVAIEAGVIVSYAGGASPEKKSSPPISFSRPAVFLPVATINVTVGPKPPSS